MRETEWHFCHSLLAPEEGSAAGLRLGETLPGVPGVAAPAATRSPRAGRSLAHPTRLPSPGVP